jgi:hypothetical protein
MTRGSLVADGVLRARGQARTGQWGQGPSCRYLRQEPAAVQAAPNGGHEGVVDFCGFCPATNEPCLGMPCRQFVSSSSHCSTAEGPRRVQEHTHRRGLSYPAFWPSRNVWAAVRGPQEIVGFQATNVMWCVQRSSIDPCRCHVFHAVSGASPLFWRGRAGVSDLNRRGRVSSMQRTYRGVEIHGTEAQMQPRHEPWGRWAAHQ